jgi:glycyl-tRNA synthetase beta chain
VLAEALPKLVLGIPWPKTMYWTSRSGARFIRPIRWIVALLDDSVVTFEIEGVTSGHHTHGHRLAGAGPVFVTIDGYERELAAHGVLLAAAARRERIEQGIAKLLAGSGNRIEPDAALLETLVYLTENPTPILGAFSAGYLRLPREVLSTVMRHHQRYFSIEDAKGNLAPQFIAVMNTGADPDGLVRSGNERVLRARFNDAQFFWQGDLKRPLESRLEDLKNVTFQAQLGSYYDKTKRVVKLVESLGGGADAAQAALLSKCDLTTSMVKELTELQGVMGGLYAREQGEPENVWRGVYEHYKPLSMDDSIPSTKTGQFVALADKLDTLRACFGAGLIPSGSKDPFALRRAAQGVVKILVEGETGVQLEETGELGDFLLDRVKYYFREVRGFAYDEVNAVLAAGWGNLPDALRRLEAVRAVRPTANFEPLAASFKRIRNILKQAGVEKGGEVDAALFDNSAERALFEEMNAVTAAVHAEGVTYSAALDSIASLRPHVDHFFDQVLVNSADERIRANRLTLLCNLLTEFSTIADFSEIVTEKAESGTHSS